MNEMRTDRHDPRNRDDYISIQHVERYRFACRRLTPGSRVLDVACGTGYGTAMLREHGCHVVSGDLDPFEIANARRRIQHDDFVCLDVRNLPFVDGSFDAVVSFETIEHIVEGGQFLNEIRRVLKPGGIFIGSTPNIAYTAHPWYHVKEYKPEEYFSLVLSKFGNIEYFGQYFRRRDRLSDIVSRLAANRHRIIHLPVRIAILAVQRMAALFSGFGTKGHHDPYAADRSQRTPETKEKPAGHYAVVDLTGEFLLRIMVSVSCK